MSQRNKSIWHETPSIEDFIRSSRNTAMAHAGIELTEVGEDYLIAKMPVDSRTHQPAGLLHGGMSVMLAESIASWGAANTIDAQKSAVVGQEINANHIRPVASGWVYATAKPVYIGSKTQVWETKIANEAGKLCCISRMTVAILDTPIKHRKPRS